MEFVIAALYLIASAVLPLTPFLRARFLSAVHAQGYTLLLFKDDLPEGRFMASVWAYGAWCIIVDAKRTWAADEAELTRGLRHELGHFVMGHARMNTLLCACGLWFLTPLFRRRQEREADMFAITVKGVGGG